MNPDLQRRLIAALERPHRLGTIGGDLEEQLAHCASFSAVLGQFRPSDGEGLCVDLGTGGGLPGVVLAALWPQSRWVLTEMRTARATEVERVVARLGMADRVEVYAGPAQQLSVEAGSAFDVVVARSFGPPSVTAECGAPLLTIGGILLVSEPPTSGELRWPTEALATLGLGAAQLRQQQGLHFAAMVKLRPTSAAYPRQPARGDRGWPLS